MSRLVPLAAAVLALSVTGCVTGDRPTLAETPSTTGDPAVDAVLGRLDASRQATFTADYDVLTRFGDLHSPATVVQSAADRRAVTVGTVRFIFEGPVTATCEIDTGLCSDRIDAGMISNTQLAPDFYGTSAAARLRRDALARVGATSGSTQTIAGQPATCVSVPVTGSSSVYCALDDGALARLDAADVAIELTAYSPEPDERRFARHET